MPVPLRETTSGEFVAFELMEMLPADTPVVVGAKRAVIVAVAPAPIVCCAAIPVWLYPAPFAVTLLMVIVELPEFVSVMGCVLLAPTLTLLKLKLPGFAPRVLPAAMALPVIESVCEPFCPLSVKAMLPVIPFVEVGVKRTVNVADPFGATVAGMFSPPIEKPAPDTMAEVTERFIFPLLLRVTLCELVCPTVTLLKFKEEGEKPAIA
jgi:hypothetical protein